LQTSAWKVSPPRLLRLVWVLVLWAAAPSPAWAGPSTKVFPLSASREMPAGLEGTPEKLTNAVATMVGGKLSDHSIDGAALAAGCTLDDSTCLDRIARQHRVKEIVFGTIRVGGDLRVFVKLTRFIAGTERRERTFVLTSETPTALARQLTRSAREMFELGPLDEDGAPRASISGTSGTGTGTGTELDEPEQPVRETAAAIEEPSDPPPAVRRGRVSRGTYFLISGGVMALAVGTGFGVAAYSLRDDLENAQRDTPDDLRRLAAIERAGRIRTTTSAVLLVSGGLALGGGIVRAVIQRRPIEADRGIAVVPTDGGAAVVFSGRLP
jgi:hypothetical protein